MTLKTALYFDNVIGVPQKHREAFQAALIVKWFLNEGGDWIEDVEVEKTPREIELIRFAQDHAVVYLRTYGKKRLFELPLSHIHILKDGGTEEFTNGKHDGGSASSTLGSILIDREQSELEFVLKVFHENIHWGEWTVIQYSTQEKVTAYRGGLCMYSRNAACEYFDDLSEAITGIFDRRFYHEVLVNSEEFVEEAKNLDIEVFSRERESKRMNELFDELWNANQDKFTSRDEIAELFIHGYLFGPVLPIARLIENTMGKGSFRKLGEETGSFQYEEETSSEP